MSVVQRHENEAERKHAGWLIAGYCAIGLRPPTRLRVCGPALAQLQDSVIAVIGRLHRDINFKLNLVFFATVASRPSLALAAIRASYHKLCIGQGGRSWWPWVLIYGRNMWAKYFSHAKSR